MKSITSFPVTSINYQQYILEKMLSHNMLGKVTFKIRIYLWIFPNGSLPSSLALMQGCCLAFLCSLKKELLEGKMFIILENNAIFSKQVREGIKKKRNYFLHSFWLAGSKYSPTHVWLGARYWSWCWVKFSKTHNS